MFELNSNISAWPRKIGGADPALTPRAMKTMPKSAPDRDSLQYLITTREIADLAANGNSSTVVGWRNRYATFPPPITPGRTPLFDADAVFAWLQDDAPRSTTSPVIFSPPDSRWWWAKAAEAFRRLHPGGTGRSYLAALVLLHQVLRGDVRAIALSPDEPPEPWIGGVDPAAGAERVEIDHPALRGLLADPLRALEVDPSHLAELSTRLQAADGSVPSSQLLEIALGPEDGTAISANWLTTTSTDLSQLIASIALSDGRRLRVLDPAAGEGRLLLRCARVAEQRDIAVELFGQELDADPWRIARTAALLEPVEANLAQPGHDSITDDQWPDLRADLVVIDPPVQPAAPALDRWLVYATTHLADHGRAAIVLPASAVVPVRAARKRPSHALQQMITELAKRGQVEVVLLLPRRARADVVGPVTIWLIDRGAASRSETMLVDLASVLRPSRAATQPDSADGVSPIYVTPVADLVTAWRAGKRLQPRPDLRARPIRPDRLLEDLGAAAERLEHTASRSSATPPTTSDNELQRKHDRLERALRRQSRAVNDLARALAPLLDTLWKDDQAQYWVLRRLLDRAREPSTVDPAERT